VRIGLNAHLLSFEASYRQAGVSRYIDALLTELPAVLNPGEDLIAYTSQAGAIAGRARYDRRILWRSTRIPSERPPGRILWEQTAGQLAGHRARLDLFHAPVNVAPLLSQTPSVVTVHDLAFERFPEQYPVMKQRYLRAMTRLSVRRAARVIAVSEATKHDLCRLYGCDPGRVTVVPNGIAAEMRRPPEDDIERFRAEQRLPDRFVLFVGTLQPRKNLETLLRAFALLQAELEWPLVVVGAPGWRDAPIYRLVESLGLRERVRFAGFAPAETLPYWYGAATLLVYPSFYEGFGLPVLEAMACRTPVVVSNASSLPEVVGDAGLLVSPRDVEGFAEAIGRLARQDGLRQELGAAGWRRSQTFRWRSTAEATAAVYREVAAGMIQPRKDGAG
jgi:glycosyltransferase involved in cell wall biosynthesis